MRKTPKLLSLMLALCLTLGLVPTLAEGLTLTDMMNREVKLAGPAKQIVVLTPSDCEILYALGVGDRVVGRGTYCNYPEAVKAVAEVASGKDANLEQIVALKPDLVLMSTMGHSKELVEAIEKAGVPVLVTDAQTIEGVYTAIRLIAKAVGQDEAAETLVKDMQDRFAALKEKAAKVATGQTIYFETSPLAWGLYTAGKKTFMQELADILNLKNILDDLEDWPPVSEEQVITRNPQIIVTTSMYFGEGPKPLEELLSRKGWEEISAIQDGRCLNADANEITRPGPRLIDAAEALYTFVFETTAADAA